MSSTLPSPALTSSSSLPNPVLDYSQHTQNGVHPNGNGLSSAYQPRSSQPLAGPSAPSSLQPQSQLQSYNVPPPAPARPRPIPFERMDTHAIKQELHDALGEDGLPYWKALNGYLLGQIARDELESMVRSWFKGEKVKLHNRLLLSLLNNASAPSASHVPLNPLTAKKRKRVAPDDPEFDLDETLIEPKMRVQNWVMGMGGRERNRLRRAVLGKAGEEVDPDRERVPRDAGWSTFAPGSLIPPLALPSRHLPSSTQLSLRLSQYAKQQSLSLSQDAVGDIGEFMAVGIDSHLGDVLHEMVSLTAHDRPSGDTVRIPQGTRASLAPFGGFGFGQDYKMGSNQIDRRMSVDGFAAPTNGNIGRGTDPGRSLTGGQTDGGMGVGVGVGEMPKPDLISFQHLFLLNQGLHPQISPALYQLANSQTLAEVEMNTPNVPPEAQVESQPQSAVGYGNVQALSMAERTKNNLLGISNGPVSVSGPTAKSAKAATSPAVKAETVTQNLLASGLLKIDKAGRQSEVEGAEGKKERKHNLHWKYEDPAVILKDILG
ncbi:hypothetical protein IAU59_003928 [Kwoniella sp. CBS 9459]